MTEKDSTVLLQKSNLSPVDMGSSQRSENQRQHPVQAINDLTEPRVSMADQEFTKAQLSRELPEMTTNETDLTQGLHGSRINDEIGKTLIEPTQNKASNFLEQEHPAKTGDVLNNRYQLEEQLGQGGMGSVFKALDLTKQAVHAKNHYVAIKVLLTSLAKDSVLVTGFHREAEKAQKLTHTNIIKVYDSSRDGDRHYIVMEYLQGESLSQTIKQNGAMPLKRAWPIIRSMGRGLAHAHEENIIHSDFKPANVFVLKGSNDVKILDFGIASELKKAGEKDETIFDPRLQGGLTTQYASFEMLNGAVTADRRDDIFAFGLVIYELLTGKHPYNRRPASEIYLAKKKGLFQPPDRPAGLSKTQWHLLSQAIAIEQEHRPDNLQAWLKAFDPEQNDNNSLKKLLIPVSVLLALGAAGGFFALQNQHSDLKTTVQETTKGSKISEASFKKMLNSPVANAGQNQQVLVGQIVKPNGSASQTKDGGPLIYDWQILEKPKQSKSLLTSNNSATPKLIPDQPGLYRLKLVVTDSLNQLSQPAEVAITAIQPPAKLQLNTIKHQYQINQHLQINVQPSQDGYLGLVHISSTGEKQQIFPNPLQKDSQVIANQTYQIPPKEKPKMLQIRGPEGTDTLIAFFSNSPLPEKLESHITKKGDITGLQPDVIVEKAQYQVIQH
jgi:serine/threonine protein kinase